MSEGIISNEKKPGTCTPEKCDQRGFDEPLLQKSDAEGCNAKDLQSFKVKGIVIEKNDSKSLSRRLSNFL